MSWSARQYRRFEQARNRPIIDLLSRLPRAGVARAIDVGCGPGNSTELLKRRYPQADIHGIDSSSDMIAAARARLPTVDFQLADISRWQAHPPYDLILANAVLQWLPGHDTLFPHLLNQLTPGGHLALQMPDNLDEPAHRAMRDVAARPRWAQAFADVGALREKRHDPAWYVARLEEHTSQIDIWRTTYHHMLIHGVDGVIEWFKGSALRPYMDRLSADDGQEFLAEYRDAIDGVYPALADGALLLPFPRLFMVLTALDD